MASGRTTADIEHELAEARRRLAENLTVLITETHPKAVAHRAVEEGKRRTRETIEDTKGRARDMLFLVKNGCDSFFRDEQRWRWDRVAAVGGAIAAVVAVGFVLRGSKKK